MLSFLSGFNFFTSAIVIIALPKFRKEIKVQTLVLFAISISLIIFASVSYYGVESDNRSFFGIEGYAVILICFLLFLLTTPTLFSNINLNLLFIIFLGVSSVLLMYFLASPSGNIISDDGTRYYAPIITELNIGDYSSVIYERPVRGVIESGSLNNLEETALIIFFIFVYQFFTYLTMRGNISFKNFKPYMAILSIGAITWAALFYGVGYPLWKILLIAVVCVITSPLVWQAFNVYRVKLRSQEGLEKWGGLSDDRLV